MQRINKMKKVLTNNLVLILGVIFTIVGAIVIAVGVVSNISSKEFMENAVSANAIIEEIEVDEHGDETDHYVFVTYEYDGNEYNRVQLNYYSSDMYEGQEIEIYFNPDDPRDVRTSEGELFFAIFPIAFGCLFIAIGLPMIIYKIHKKNKKTRLIESGQRIIAEIESIDMDYNITINGRHPYRVFCNYNNPYDGYIYKFKSDILSFNPNDFYNIGNPVDVYVEQGNFKNYYVDVIDKSEGLVRDYT